MSSSVAIASRSAPSHRTNVGRSKAKLVKRAEELFGYSNESRSEHLLQHQSPTRRAVREGLFVVAIAQPKFRFYPGSPKSHRSPRENRLRGRPACAPFPSAKTHAECHDRRLSSNTRREGFLASKARSPRDRERTKILL